MNKQLQPRRKLGTGMLLDTDGRGGLAGAKNTRGLTPGELVENDEDEKNPSAPLK